MGDDDDEDYRKYIGSIWDGRCLEKRRAGTGEG